MTSDVPIPQPIPARQARRWLAAIVLLAAALRLWGAFFDLPYIYHPDEPLNIESVQDMVANGSLNPHRFWYPSLFYDLDAAAMWAYSSVRSIALGGPWPQKSLAGPGIGMTITPDPMSVALLRSISIVGGVLATLLMFRIGRHAQDATTGLIAAALFAISPQLIDDSQHIIPDGYIIPFALASILAAQRVAARGDWPAYLWAGLATGLTAAAKYNAALVCVGVATAHFLRVGASLTDARRLLAAGLLCVLTFFAVSPYVLLDFPAFSTDYLFQLHHYSSGHAGMEGDVLPYYATQLWRDTGLAVILACAQIVWGWRRRHATTIILAVFTVCYLAFICQFPVRNARTLSPAIPGILLLSAICLRRLAAVLAQRARLSMRLRGALLGVLAIGLAAAPLTQTIAHGIRATTIDSRTTARVWMDANLPAGALVVVESYAPFIDMDRFRVVWDFSAIDKTPQWYVDNAIDYVVLSQGTYGRYFENPRRYAAEIGAYLRLMQSLDLVKRFNDGDYEVLVYKTRRAASGQ